MKKRGNILKVMSFIFTLTFIFSVFNISAFASEVGGNNNLDKVIKIVNEANRKIDMEIDKASFEGNALKVSYEKELSKLNMCDVNYNQKINELNNWYNTELDIIIQNLIDVTNDISAEYINEASRYGVTVVCELIKVKIADRNVWVDPLRVIAE